MESVDERRKCLVHAPEVSVEALVFDAKCLDHLFSLNQTLIHAKDVCIDGAEVSSDPIELPEDR